MPDFVYLTEQEYPSIQLIWKDGNDAAFSFSSAYKCTVMLAEEGEAVATKTSGVVGASTSPNVTINWPIGELDIAPGDYNLIVTARDDVSKDRMFRPGSPPQVQIVATPAPVGN